MTHVVTKMTMSWSQVHGMVDYRHIQSNKNTESLLNALQELNKNKGPVSSREIEQYLRKKKRRGDAEHIL
jgi:hypothetical protein